MLSGLKRILPKKKHHEPTPAEQAREKANKLIEAMTTAKPGEKPPLRLVSGRSLETELTDDEETPPRGSP